MLSVFDIPTILSGGQHACETKVDRHSMHLQGLKIVLHLTFDRGPA
jgi:hypothetical protein